MMKYCLLAFAILISISSFSQSHAKISNRLQKAIEANADDYIHFSILLKDRFDIISLDNDLNARRASIKERVKIVEESLQQKASSTQPAILSILNASDQVIPESIHPYWITNIIFCKAKASIINQLATRTDIAYLDLNVELKTSAVKQQLQLPVFNSPNGAEPGLKVVNADKLWALGYTGYGRVAYVADTGIDPTHPAFANKTRSNFISKSQTWYDFQGGDTPFSCGDHGSHVLGTILGLDRLENDTVGVAFNAQWLGGVVLCGVGTEDNLAGLQWAIDPDKNPLTIEDMPDVINNSWYDPDVDDDCTSGYVDVETALEAAGIASVFSAGNEGPDPQTITPPHNININLVNSFTVAAINGNNSQHLIADFSSRGPSKCGGTGSLLIKPEVAAPGENVRSCSYNGKYVLYSGTSMAAPHTCGVILLLKEAFPYLSGFDLKMAVYHTCTDLGDPGEDNFYGMGLINAWAAYNYLIAQGNVPVDPHRKKDLILINVETNPYHCEKTLTAKAFIENAGSETITDFDLDLNVTDKSGSVVVYNYKWNGILLPGERLEYQVPSVELNLGKSNLLFEITKVNNGDDDGPLNNRVSKVSVIVDNPVQNAGIVGGIGISACEGTQIMVQGTFNELEGRVDWYDANNGNKLGSGNPFLLPPAYDTTTVLMQPVHFASLGIKDLTGTLNEFVGEPYGGIRFRADYPFVLKSVKIYNTTKGLRKLVLYNRNFVKLEEQSTSLFTLGEHTVNLNFPVPGGAEYYLALSKDGKSLAWTDTGAVYPYDVENVASIISSTTEKDHPGSYAYFYDWKIEYNDFCGLVPVQIPYLDSTITLNAAFAVEDTTSFILTPGTFVSFTDTSLNAVSWIWNFGDGTTSTEQNPVHQYLSPGKYKVTLIVNNVDGCFDTRQKDIVIELKTAINEPSFSENYKLYPNPNNGTFIIEANAKSNKPVSLNIFNSIGIEINRLEYTSNTLMYNLDITEQPAGLYWIRLNTEKGNFLTSVVKE